ncbi:MAG: flagellar FlbD family protein [Bacillota bacterium]|nr:flagellar FlbD family protein [Bacillota bacterium]HOB92071.1 flagellar FlbD family protein [Bacillota bacterium]HPZ54364.1 flagellar FlbD family protein [Bacillota bacterium]HQD18547.1 flagellar FlbD family protein [Bacillota bacterium]
MIELTRLNGTTIVINSDLIETVEETPDTVVTLTIGTKYVVQESSRDIVDKVVEFRRRIMRP